MARAGDELVHPVTGERIVFRKTAAETDGTLLEMDDYWTQPGHRGPEHIHPELRESWKVIAGTARFRIDGVEQTAGPGELVVAEPGVPHQAWNPTAEPVHLRIQMRPALNWETFIERLFTLAADAHNSGHEAPDPGLVSRLLRDPRLAVDVGVARAGRGAAHGRSARGRTALGRVGRRARPPAHTGAFRRRATTRDLRSDVKPQQPITRCGGRCGARIE